MNDLALKQETLPYLTTVQLQSLHLNNRDPVAYGGIGNLYSVRARATLPGGIKIKEPLLLKTLDRSHSGNEQEAYFRNIDSLARALGAKRHHFFSRLALPLALVENGPGNLVGFLMREFSEDCKYLLPLSSGAKSALQEVKIFLNSQSQRLEYGTPRLSREDVLWLVGDFLSTLGMLHERSVSVGDLSHSNLIVQHHRSSMRVLFLDVDSFSINGAPHPLGLQTSPLYRAPEEIVGMEATSPFSSDVYKAGLIVARLLCQLAEKDEHSYDVVDLSRCRQFIVEFGGQTLVSLFERALSEDPGDRPSALLLSKVWNDELSYL